MSSRLGPDAAPDASNVADNRLVPVALALWAGVLAGLTLSLLVVAGAVIAATVAVVAVRQRSNGARRTVIVAIACLLAGIALGVARAEPVRHGMIADLAAEHARIKVVGEVAADPKVKDGYVVGRLRVREVIEPDRVVRVRDLVVVVGDDSWAGTQPGQRMRLAGRLEPTRWQGRESAMLTAAGDPDVIDADPSVAARLTEPLRSGLRDAAATIEGDERGLIPALLVGDESLVTDNLRDAMRDSGLTHLTAVSGMNVTIVLVLVLGLARWLGARGYVLHAIAVLAVLGFVALARPDPSVVRAATMGTIAIGAMVIAGHRRGVRTLAAAVVVLLLIDPWLARAPGFALSVVATGAILLLTPLWQRAAWWLPRPIAIAVTVPLAAQAASLPIIVGIGGPASLASLPANILAAPAVAPITVLAAGAAVAAPVLPGLAAGFAWLGAWPARWIAGVARWSADLPGAAIGWPGGAMGVVLAVVVSAVLVAMIPRILRRPVVAVGAAMMVSGALLVPPSRLPVVGWPPPDWQLLVCDVGQGDAMALPVADSTAVVVDAGGDPDAVRRCLDEMGIDHVALLVLTHYDADHVMGVPGLLDGRAVDRAVVSPVAEPEANARVVLGWLRDAGASVEVAEPGLRQRIGQVALEVMWPRRPTATGSVSNNASVVVRAEVAGLGMLLTGDIEPSAQVALKATMTDGSPIDILKVPHHGSPNQSSSFLTSTGARLAVVSVGENDYGHPARGTLDDLRGAGMAVARTDERGTFAVVKRPDGTLAIADR